MKYQSLPQDVCQICQQKECHLLCGELKKQFDLTWLNTYKRKPKFELFMGRLERTN